MGGVCRIALLLGLVGCLPTIGEGGDRDRDGYGADIDCNDDDPAVNPGVAEICDGIDNDCDGVVDGPGAEGAATFYEDRDGDGFGDNATAVVTCFAAADFVARGGDCDDTNGGIHPDAEETCDPRDEDCDGDPFANAADARVFFYDADGDRYAGTEAGSTCQLPPDASWTADDCDDTDPLVNPEAAEVCDLVDDDCDGGLGFDVIVPEDTASVEQAVDFAPDGGRVCVLAGEWPVAADLGKKSVTIVGQGVGATWLTAGVAGAQRFVVTREGNLTLEDVNLGVVVDDEALGVYDGALTLRRVDVDGIENNEWDSGYRGSLVNADGASVRLEDVRVHGISTSIDVVRNALLVGAEDTVVAVDGVAVAAIDAPSANGSLFLVKGGRIAGSGLTVSDARFGKEVGGSAGVVLVAYEGASVDLGQVSVRDVTIENAWGGLFLFGQEAQVELDHLDVVGLDVDGGIGALMYAAGHRDITLEHVRLVDSTATDVEGWVNVRHTGGDLVMRNVLSAGNTLTHEGSFSPAWFATTNASFTSIAVENATFLDDPTYGPISLAILDELMIDLTNVFLGEAMSGGLVLRGCHPDWDCGVRADHVATAFDESDMLHPVWWRSGGVYDVISLTDEVTDPGFVSVSGDPRTWDLRLLAMSPLVDAGTPDLHDRDGSRSDIGAYGGPAGDDW